MQLLREPRRERTAAGVRQRLPDRMPDLRRPRRSGERGRADRGARSRPASASPRRARFPKVFYIAAEESAIQPEIATRPFIYKEGQVLLRPLGSPEADPSRPGDARVDYDTPHAKPWGFDMALYLLTKGIATGTMLVGLLLPIVLGDARPLTTIAGPAISLRVPRDHRGPADRRSRSARALLLHPASPELAIVDGVGRVVPHRAGTADHAVDRRRSCSAAAVCWSLLVWPLVLCSILTTGYTGFLFAQGLARDLWQGPHSTLDLFAQAIVEGSAVLLLASLFPGLGDPRFTRVLTRHADRLDARARRR